MADAKQYLLDTLSKTGDALVRAGEAGVDSAANMNGVKGIAGSMLQGAFNTQGYQDKQAQKEYARQRMAAETKQNEIYLKNADELSDIQMNQERNKNELSNIQLERARNESAMDEIRMNQAVKGNELYNQKHALEMQKVAQQRFATAVDMSNAALQTRLSSDPQNAWNMLTPEQQKAVMKTPQWNNLIQTGVVANLCVKSMGGDKDATDTVWNMMRLQGYDISDATTDKNNPTGRITDGDGNTFDINQQNMTNAFQYGLSKLDETIRAHASISPLNTRDNAVWDTRASYINNYMQYSLDTDIAGASKIYDDIYNTATPRAQFTHVFRKQLEEIMANPQLVNDPHFMQRAGIMIAPNETGRSMLEDALGYSFDPNNMQFTNLTYPGEIINPEEMLMRLENDDKIGQMVETVYANRNKALMDAREAQKNAEMAALAKLMGGNGDGSQENKTQKPIYIGENGELTEEAYNRYMDLYRGKDEALGELSPEQVNHLISTMPNSLQNEGIKNGIFKSDGGLGVSLDYDLNSELVDMKGRENELAKKLIKGYEGLISMQNSELERFKIDGDFDPLRLKEKKQAVIDAINKQKQAIEDMNDRIKQQKFDGQARDRSRDFAGVGGGMGEYEHAMQRPPQSDTNNSKKSDKKDGGKDGGKSKKNFDLDVGYNKYRNNKKLLIDSTNKRNEVIASY